MLVPLADADPAEAGAKAGTLGRLLRAGFPVPDGVVVPFGVHRHATEVDGRDGRAKLLPPGLTAELDAVFGDAPVAVRSSAEGEDGASASAAGQYETVLGVRGAAAVAEAVRACWASLRSPRAVAYRGPGGAPAMAVLVQRHVQAEVAGVLFTDAGWVEASWGLGESVVGGLVTPDAWAVRDGRVTQRSLGGRRTRRDLGEHGVVTREVTDEGPCLDDATVLRVAALGDEVAALLGAPQDVEWALADGRLHLLQARPVTAPLAGVPGAAGTATGPVRVVTGPADFGRVRAGDVLVCRTTDPAWTPLFGLVAAVVTETGGRLAHAAIVARERGIPAALGVPGVTTGLRDGQQVIVDGRAGTIRVIMAG